MPKQTKIIWKMHLTDNVSFTAPLLSCGILFYWSGLQPKNSLRTATLPFIVQGNTIWKARHHESSQTLPWQLLNSSPQTFLSRWRVIKRFSRLLVSLPVPFCCGVTLKYLPFEAASEMADSADNW